MVEIKIDVEKCTGCGSCTLACRLKGRIPNEFDMRLSKRGAAYIPFPQAV
ncbi:MAG: 4Fe-4S binding protein, partial [Candidatus Jordarchaeaceae archaeon]